MSYLDKLINKIVLSVDTGISETYPIKTKENKDAVPLIETYLQLIFENYYLNIYNPGVLEGTSNQSFKNLENLKLTKIDESKNEVIFFFQNGITLRVDLRPEAYKGPEAMCLYGSNDLIVVWN